MHRATKCSFTLPSPTESGVRGASNTEALHRPSITLGASARRDLSAENTPSSCVPGRARDTRRGHTGVSSKRFCMKCNAAGGEIFSERDLCSSDVAAHQQYNRGRWLDGTTSPPAHDRAKLRPLALADVHRAQRHFQCGRHLIDPPISDRSLV